ncbi:MAG: hypothetical protein HQK94_16680 [Nitrospirae bacterium]|nr:hypothetical protein [Nitrospirota bacterium]
MKLFFITDNEGMYLSYKKVFGVLLSIDAYLIEPANGIDEGLLQKEDIFIIEGNMQKVSRWLWDVIRKRYLNPVIVLGYDREEHFLKNNPAFKQGAAKYHKYVPPPHSLAEIFTAIDYVVPVYDEDTRKILFERYGSPYVEDRLFRLIDHDLKFHDKDKDISVLEEALQYSTDLQSAGLREKLLSAIDYRSNDDIKSVQNLKTGILELLKEGNKR